MYRLKVTTTEKQSGNGLNQEVT